MAVIFNNVAFGYDGMAEPLLESASIHFDVGWTGIVGANGAGKTTVLKLAARLLQPVNGHIDVPPHSIYCAQRTDNAPGELTGLLEDNGKEAQIIRGELGIGFDWPYRWSTLSHGERKRAQIGTALWLEPDVLAVDEPTNHLDHDARLMLMDALESYKGVGLLVSHDRELLDNLCGQCLFLEPPEAILRPGNYSTGFEQDRMEEDYREHQRQQAKQQVSRVRRDASRHREAASRANRERSKRGLHTKDHDARSKIDLARLSGKDGTAGRRLQQAEGRLRQAHKKLEQFKVKKQYQTGIWLPGSRKQGDALFSLPAGSVGVGEKQLTFPPIIMRPGDRVALTGPNGCGKSTIVNHIMQYIDTERIRVIYMPQEMDVDASAELLEQTRRLSNEQKGHLMTIVSRLGSRPHRLLESRQPSPGETRKLLLALGITRDPHLIIMDEPTNHLDLPSIQCLENALSDCPCGLLLVSHDEHFLSALTEFRWNIVPRHDKINRLEVNV